jgi:hypothetical protein
VSSDEGGGRLKLNKATTKRVSLFQNMFYSFMDDKSSKNIDISRVNSNRKALSKARLLATAERSARKIDATL